MAEGIEDVLIQMHESPITTKQQENNQPNTWTAKLDVSPQNTKQSIMFNSLGRNKKEAEYTREHVPRTITQENTWNRLFPLIGIKHTPSPSVRADSSSYIDTPSLRPQTTRKR